MLGVFKARAVPVNVNFRYTAEELAYLVTDSAMAALFTEPDLATVVREAARLADRPDLVIVETGAAYDGAARRGPRPERPAVGERTDDDLYLLYTGGTTGAPKGVMWRQHDIYMASFGGRGTPGRDVPPVTDPVEVVRRAVAGTPVLRRFPLCPLMHGAVAWTAWQSLLGGGAVIIDSDVHLDPAAALRLAEVAETDLIMVVGDAVARPLADAVRAWPVPPTARPSRPAAAPAHRVRWGDPLAGGEGPTAGPAARGRHPRQLRVVGDREPGRLRPGPDGGPPRLVGDDATTTVLAVTR